MTDIHLLLIATTPFTHAGMVYYVDAILIVAILSMACALHDNSLVHMHYLVMNADVIDMRSLHLHTA